MFRIIYPNRWLFWTLAWVFIIFLLTWWAIERYSIEQDIAMNETELVYSIRIQRQLDQFENDIASWKTYRNEKYGFEFRYPANYTLHANSNFERSYLVEKDNKGVDVSTIYVNIYSNEGSDFTEWLNKKVFGYSPSVEKLLSTSRIAQIKVAGLNSFKYIGDDQSGSGINVWIDYVSRGNILSLSVEGEGLTLETMSTIVDGVIKTFQIF